jgi:uncharacterized protein YbaA (DUF1428 family)
VGQFVTVAPTQVERPTRGFGATATNPMPFGGKRVIFGGFALIVEFG